MSTLTVAAAAAFSLAAREAEQLGSVSIDVEHLFLGLCRVESLRSWRANEWPAGVSEREIRDVKRETDAFTAALESAGLNVVSARRAMRELWYREHPTRERFQGHRTQRCRQVFADAELSTGGVIDLRGLMRAILAAPSAVLDRLLSDANTSRERISAVLPAAPDTGRQRESGSVASIAADDILTRYGRDVTHLARTGKISPIIGRSDEIKQVARVLLQAKKGNPLLIGDAGVGKTAVVEGLAVQLLKPDIPASLRGARIVELSLGAVVAGTKYRGEFEERIQQVITQCEADRSLILFIDEVHMLLGAGAASSNMDAANLLKPALARGALRCIGATTIEEYRKYIEKDSALERRFQLVWIDEPTPAATVAILEGLKGSLEKHHDVSISTDAIVKAVETSVRYLPDFRLPDKAIDVLDQACARMMLTTFSPDGKKLTAEQPVVGIEEVAAVISERCRIPIHRLTATEAQRFVSMEAELGKRIIGQRDAIKAVSQAIRAGKAGVRDNRRPVATLLFLGPTGAGKTELAKAVAEFLFEDQHHLIRIDMSEYAEKHSIAKLIGSPPGYIGHEDGGYFTNCVRSCPYSVVLFDEIEKAHPDVFDLFLQMLDEGQLTDSRGRRASFRECLIVLTSNAGGSSQQSAPKRPIGFAVGVAAAGQSVASAPAREHADDESTLSGRELEDFERPYVDAAARLLRPEIRNRIHKTIVFRPLTVGAVNEILDQLIARVNQRLVPKQIRLRLTDDVRAALLAEGYSEQFGARNMERVIRDRIEEPLAALILEGVIQEGKLVETTKQGGGIGFIPA